ncbi:MAG: gamma-glutamylcyclotransferase [Oligoflexales bacterium]
MSKLELKSLKAKGVDPISFEPAFLEDWELCFDLPNFFHIEGGTGNIRPAKGKAVHGVLYECLDEQLPILDELEAEGVCYDRKKKKVKTYLKRSALALVYVGIEDRRKEGQQPSQRYKNILVQGANEMNLSKHYIQELEAIEVKPEPVLRPFRFPSQPSRIFSLHELQQLKQHTALAGAVFDMSSAREDHSYLKEFFDGRDMSLFFLKRMDSSDGFESFEKIIDGSLSSTQKHYLTNYHHEFDREYCYVGRMDYQINLAENTQTNILRQPLQRQFIPSRAILDYAEKINSSLQHENLGFLSIEHGFMPKYPPKTSLPSEFIIWDQMIRQLPNLYRSLELRKMIDEMPFLDASENHLGDAYLLRAASVIAMLSHAYAYTETNKTEVLPLNLSKPWNQIRKRLGREQEVLSYIDLIVYNWKFKDPNASNISNFTHRKVENLDLLIPTVGNSAENLFYLTQTEILAQTSPIIHSIVNCQEAVKNGDTERLKEHLLEIIDVLEKILEHSLPKINPCEDSLHFVDPVLWSKTVAPFAVPIKDGLQGPSGTSSPVFNLMDVFLGRKEYSTFLGKEIKSLRGTYPLFWQEFIKAVAEISISSFIEKSDDKALKSLLKDTVNLYAGENGFLGKHRLKVFGYLETAFKVGRNVTFGGFSGAFRDRTWEQVDSELEYSRKERMLSFPKGCHYAVVKSIGQTHLSGAEGVKHVVLDISHTGIRYQPGDRCGILPENSCELVEKTLKALKAKGDEQIPLSDEWIQATSLRHGYQDSRSLSLRFFLKFARIRPVEPRLAEALHASSQSPMLLEAILHQKVVQWELCDLLSYSVKMDMTLPDYGKQTLILRNTFPG